MQSYNSYSQDPLFISGILFACGMLTGAIIGLTGVILITLSIVAYYNRQIIFEVIYNWDNRDVSSIFHKIWRLAQSDSTFVHDNLRKRVPKNQSENYP